MLHRIWAIAWNTYREAIRQKILYVLAFFAVLLILFSFVLGQLSLHADVKVIKDMGLASTFVFSSLMAIFIGLGLVFKEIDRRTIYTLLSKPVSRGEFILGKFVGLAITLLMMVASMTALLFLMLSWYRNGVDMALLKAVILIYMEVCILAAVALFFSSYSSSIMSAIFCISFLITGHITDDFAAIMRAKLAKMTPSDDAGGGFFEKSARTGLDLLEHLNLDHLAISSDIVHGVQIPWTQVMFGIIYAITWILVILTGAIWLFRRKDLQ